MERAELVRVCVDGGEGCFGLKDCFFIPKFSRASKN